MIRCFTLAFMTWISLCVDNSFAQTPIPGELPFKLSYWSLSGRMTLEVTRPESTHLRVSVSPAECFIKPAVTLVPCTEQRVSANWIANISPMPNTGHYDLGYLIDPAARRPDEAINIEIWYGWHDFSWSYFTHKMGILVGRLILNRPHSLSLNHPACSLA